MRFLVIGGSGRTGKLVIAEALNRGHQVTALVRNVQSVQEQAGLVIVQGTPTNHADVAKAITAVPRDIPDAVIVTLNAPRQSDSPFSKPIAPPTLLADCNNAIIAAMKEHKIQKIVNMAAFGVADSYKSLNFLMKGVIRYSNMSIQFKDHDQVDRQLEESGLEFVSVRPVMLKGTEKLPVKDLGDQGRGASFMPQISRASVATFLVDAAESNNWTGRTPVICN